LNPLNIKSKTRRPLKKPKKTKKKPNKYIKNPTNMPLSLINSSEN
jgi:hypothetical protein